MSSRHMYNTGAVAVVSDVREDVWAVSVSDASMVMRDVATMTRHVDAYGDTVWTAKVDPRVVSEVAAVVGANVVSTLTAWRTVRAVVRMVTGDATVETRTVTGAEDTSAARLPQYGATR